MRRPSLPTLSIGLFLIAALAAGEPDDGRGPATPPLAAQPAPDATPGGSESLETRLPPGQLRVRGRLGPVVPISLVHRFPLAWHLAGPSGVLVTLHLSSFDPGPAGPSICHQPSFAKLPGPVGKTSIEPPAEFDAGDRRWIWVCAKDTDGEIVGATNAVLIEGSATAGDEPVGSASGTRSK